ncbi:DUF2322 family protein [Testudinibacter sp. P80/BLE/0925]|uniref:DUF2322 family protein n=1 Tax=Testudinibacter sp. TW-1 TaxID=3417757 RepID=UPI003D35CE9F
MTFQDYLATMPRVENLSGLNVLNAAGDVIHHIPAIAGKLGSLRLYNALAEHFAQQLHPQAARQGLIWFAEHVADAERNPGKHPNIDLLFRVLQTQQTLQLQPLR